MIEGCVLWFQCLSFFYFYLFASTSFAPVTSHCVFVCLSRVNSVSLLISFNHVLSDPLCLCKTKHSKKNKKKTKKTQIHNLFTFGAAILAQNKKMHTCYYFSYLLVFHHIVQKFDSLHQLHDPLMLFRLLGFHYFSLFSFALPKVPNKMNQYLSFYQK